LRISVIGCGYVGLVTGACLAELGHQVVCSDKDEERITALKSGIVPIYEPHLEGILAANRDARRLSFTADAGEAVRASEAIFICVGTPPLKTGDADLSAIDSVARIVAAEARSPKLVIEKSTVPAQTGQQLKRALELYCRREGVQFRVASNPEFLREGTAVEDFLHPDRIVLGVEEQEAEEQLREIYGPILENNFRCPVHPGKCPRTRVAELVVTTINSAELIKHASNSFLALKISYANVIADLCEKVDADVREVTRAMGLDPRIGPGFLNAGLGFGGYCLPKDVQAFIQLADRCGVDSSLFREIERINKLRVDRCFEKVRQALWVVKDKRVGALGLAFKGNTDDIRFAPALAVIGRLVAEGAHLRAYDPQAMEKSSLVLPQVKYCANAYEAARDAEALLVLTDWDEFLRLDWRRVYETMARPLVIDGRNLLDPALIRGIGFEYYGFGCRKQPPRPVLDSYTPKASLKTAPAALQVQASLP
jgi:UDPglucose 6-dehydrogenase